MSTWGTGIFSDDLACDIRDDFRDLIAEGKSAEAATRQLVREYAESIHELGEGPAFWIALAAAQMQSGRLLERVRGKAVKIIDEGGDLASWVKEGIDPRIRARRKAALARLRKGLLGPPRAARGIRRVRAHPTSWKVGHAISYRLQSGKYVILRVLGFFPLGESGLPIVDLCDWIGHDIPSPSEIQNLRGKLTMRDALANNYLCEHQFVLSTESAPGFPADRVALVATGLRVARVDLVGAPSSGSWKALDSYVLTTYGIQ